MKLTAIITLALAGAAQAKYWMEEIGHFGRSPYFPDSHYRVFRDVRDYGAVGDGGLCILPVSFILVAHTEQSLTTRPQSTLPSALVADVPRGFARGALFLPRPFISLLGMPCSVSVERTGPDLVQNLLDQQRHH